MNVNAILIPFLNIYRNITFQGMVSFTILALPALKIDFFLSVHIFMLESCVPIQSTKVLLTHSSFLQLTLDGHEIVLEYFEIIQFAIFHLSVQQLRV